MTLFASLAKHLEALNEKIQHQTLLFNTIKTLFLCYVFSLGSCSFERYPFLFSVTFVMRKVKHMQRSGTEAIRTQIQPSKPKREITKITNSQNTKRTIGQPSEHLFLKRWQLSNPNRIKNDMNIHVRKVKRHRNSDTKNRQKKTTKNLPPWMVSIELLGGGGGRAQTGFTCKTSPSVSEVMQHI